MLGLPGRSWHCNCAVSLHLCRYQVYSYRGMHAWVSCDNVGGVCAPSPAHQCTALLSCTVCLVQSMGAGELASLVGSVARLQLPLSPMLEDAITHRLDKVTQYFPLPVACLTVAVVCGSACPAHVCCNLAHIAQASHICGMSHNLLRGISVGRPVAHSLL
jgi:hypothetical protein